MRHLRANWLFSFAQILVQINDTVRGDRVRNTLNLYFPLSLAFDLIFDVRVGLVCATLS